MIDCLLWMSGVHHEWRLNNLWGKDGIKFVFYYHCWSENASVSCFWKIFTCIILFDPYANPVSLTIKYCHLTLEIMKLWLKEVKWQKLFHPASKKPRWYSTQLIIPDLFHYICFFELYDVHKHEHIPQIICSPSSIKC